MLIHTGYASAAWWDGLVREMALGRHRVLAVDLPGHGPGAYYPTTYQTQNADDPRTETSPAAIGRSGGGR
jgi:pimeloyl-ACP methyl ester carboxylesterase